MRVGIIGLRAAEIAGQEDNIRKWIAAKLDQFRGSSSTEPPLDCFCGGGKGTDQIFGECVLASGNNLHIIFPYERKVTSAIKGLSAAAMSVSYVASHYQKGCYALQNQNMVDNIDALLVVSRARRTTSARSPSRSPPWTAYLGCRRPPCR